MEVKSIEFQFKGDRSYIQGPDIYNGILSKCYPNTGVSSIKFTAHDFINASNCTAYFTDIKSELDKVKDIRVRCQFVGQGSLHWVAIVQDENQQKPAKRVDYDEKKITSLCQVQSDKVTLTQQSPFTFIESIVSMNKHLHQKLFPEVVGKWIFTRVDLETVCDAIDHLTIHFRHNMNFRLTKSDVLVNDVKIGDIYFSLVKI